MSSSLRCFVVLSCVFAAAFALPAGASAAVYCVEMGGACPAGGTASADFTTAITAANAAADEDWIYLGATTQTVAGTASDSARTVHIVGSGRDATAINTTANAFVPFGLTLTGAGSTIERLTLRTTSSGTNGTALSLGSAIGAIAAVDVRIASDHFGVSLNEGSSLAGSSVEVPMSGSNVAAVRNYTGNSWERGRVVSDSTLRGAVGVLVNTGGGSLSVERSRITYGSVGVSARLAAPQYTQSNTTNVRVSDSVVAVEAQGPASTYAFAATADSDASAAPGQERDLVVSSRIDVARTTVSALGAGAGLDTILSAASNAFEALPVGTRHGATSAVNFDEVAVVGSFDVSVFRAETTDTANNDALSDVNISNSNIDLDPAKLTTSGAVNGPLSPATNTATVTWRTDLALADPASGDFRPTRTSPLVDAGGIGGSDGFDLGGGVRPVSAPGVVAARFDVGAFEYQFSAPTVTATGPAAAVLPGASVALTATATDADPGETAQLAYAWSFPGGGTATTAAASATAPAAPGLYVATVTVTDPAGITASVPVSFAVVAGPVPPVVVPADRLAPMVEFGKLKASLAVLVKRKAASFRLELSEAATVRATAVVVVRQPAAKRGGKPKLVKVTVASSAPTALGAGFGTMKVTASKLGAAKLVVALRVRGAKVASTTLTGNVIDAAGNKRAFSTPVTITK